MGYKDKKGHWCSKSCPLSYIEYGHQSCQQTCGGAFPAEDWGGICGTSDAEIKLAYSEMAIEVGKGALNFAVLSALMAGKGVNIASLVHTANTLIEMGMPFLRPSCPETAPTP